MKGYYRYKAEYLNRYSGTFRYKEFYAHYNWNAGQKARQYRKSYETITEIFVYWKGKWCRL